MFGISLWIFPATALVILIVSTVVFLASRYKRCPSDMILVIYGKVGEGQSANCIHGGGTLVWPLIQDYAYMSLTPMTISIPLQNALSLQNIRINVPSTFTVGISTDKAIMNNAAERLLNLTSAKIEDMAKEIIFGQLRLTVASLTIEQINQDRESFLESIRKNVEPELNKIGLYLINVNITDITDESDYIESIGKKAASEAINQARVDVVAAGETRRDRRGRGEPGEGDQGRPERRRVGEGAQEGRGRPPGLRPAAGVRRDDRRGRGEPGEGDQGRPERRRVGQGQEAGRSRPARLRPAAGGVGGRRARTSPRPTSRRSKPSYAVKQAEALRRGEVAKREAQVQIQKAQYLAEQERLTAEEVVKRGDREEEDRDLRRGRGREGPPGGEGLGRRDPGQVRGRGEGVRQVLDSKAAGYQELVKSCAGDAKAAATFLLVEKTRAAGHAPGRGDQEHQDRQGHGLGFGRRQGRQGRFVHRQLSRRPDQEPAAAAGGREDVGSGVAEVSRRDGCRREGKEARRLTGGSLSPRMFSGPGGSVC